MHVVGGTYWEWCREENWNQLFGSGMRACAAIGDGVKFSTCCSVAHKSTLERAAEIYKFELADIQKVEKTIGFFYPYALAPPIFDRIENLLSIKVKGEKVLRFGMVECNPVVDAEWVVYDPQSPNNPEAFSNNGSNAQHLAIVCNRSEARLMTGCAELDESASKLIEKEGAEVVVIKCGGEGAYVFTSADDKELIPAYKTESVWPLGSGDVYSAIFAREWFAGADPRVAAASASKGAAFFCGTRQLPVAPEYKSWFASTAPSQITGLKLKRQPRVYLAGPFFNMMQRWMIEESRSCLRSQGLDVFSPFHDVGIGPAEQVVPKDVEAIDNCDAMFAIVDHLDSGTLFEIGYATAKGIPVVGFAQDVTDERLKMLLGTGSDVFSDFCSAIYNTTWKANEQASSSPA